MTKGEAIRFKKGSFKGKTGWIDNDGSIMEQMVQVYVENWNNKGQTKNAKVMKINIAPLHRPSPSSYAEAVIQQNPDIEDTLEKLCRNLAMCDIKKDGKGIMEVISNSLEQATEEQRKLGYKKRYRQVNFSSKKKDT
jgi:hypothetical protein